MVLLFATGLAGAGQVVVFEDGRSMRVLEVRADGEAYVLSLDGGGKMTIPAWRVRRTVPFEEPEPPMPESVATPAAWRQVAGVYADPIARAADLHRVDPVLLTAMAEVESAFDPGAISPKGAQGLLQLMPATAQRFGVRDAFDVAQNVDGGARYLRWLLERFEGRTDLALAGYNAGEAAVEKYNGIPPYRETSAYVAKVMAGMNRIHGSSVSDAAVLAASGSAP